VVEKGIPKTAVTTPFGMYEFLRMFFGLRNAAQTFERFMDGVLNSLDFCYTYIDDILVASSHSPEKHYEHLKVLFEQLQKYAIIINPEKCVFGQSELEFLGYLVSGEGIRSLPERVRAISNYQRPTTARDLRIYLGMLNFCRRFLAETEKNISTAKNISNDLLQDNVRGKTPMAWFSIAQEAFDALRENLTKTALLAHPRTNAEIALFADASE